MNRRIGVLLALTTFAFGCAEQTVVENIWIEWCAEEWTSTEEAMTDYSISELRSSFVTSCNRSLASSMNMSLESFETLQPPCGFAIQADTLLWNAFFTDSTLAMSLSPKFFDLGGDSTIAINAFESCFYQTLDTYFAAVLICRPNDTTMIPLPFLINYKP